MHVDSRRANYDCRRHFICRDAACGNQKQKEEYRNCNSKAAMRNTMNYGRARACGHHLVGCDERTFCWNKNQSSIEKYVCGQLSSVFNLAPIRVLFLDEIIESDLAGSEDQDHQSEREVDERVSIVELGRIRKERGEGIAVGRDVRRKHVDHEAKCGYARKQANRKQNPGNKFKRGDKGGRGSRRRKAKAGEELRDVREIVKFGPPVQRNACRPEAEIDADTQQERRLQARSYADQQPVKFLDLLLRRTHLFSGGAEERQNQPSVDQVWNQL